MQQADSRRRAHAPRSYTTADENGLFVARNASRVAIKTSDVRTPSCNTLTAIDLFLSKDLLRADAARFSQFVRTSGARFTLARRLLSYLSAGAETKFTVPSTREIGIEAQGKSDESQINTLTRTHGARHVDCDGKRHAHSQFSPGGNRAQKQGSEDNHQPPDGDSNCQHNSLAGEI